MSSASNRSSNKSAQLPPLKPSSTQGSSVPDSGLPQSASIEATEIAEPITPADLPTESPPESSAEATEATESTDNAVNAVSSLSIAESVSEQTSDSTSEAGDDQTSQESQESREIDSAGIIRQRPIPPPSEPRQYRAIGLVRGQYAPSAEQITRGALMASDGTPINAVLLGRVMSLVKNHIDLQQSHLWVVYPRTGQHDGNLHVQIVGVWEPETLSKEENQTDDSTAGDVVKSTPKLIAVSEFEDDYFSIRGEVIYHSQEKEYLVVKIKQAPRKNDDKPKFFKLTLKGNVGGKLVGHFGEFHIQRQGNDLLIQECHDIGSLPIRRPRPGGGGGRPFDRKFSGQSRRPGDRGGDRGDRGFREGGQRPDRPDRERTGDRPQSPVKVRPTPRPNPDRSDKPSERPSNFVSPRKPVIGDKNPPQS